MMDPTGVPQISLGGGVDRIAVDLTRSREKREELKGRGEWVPSGQLDEQRVLRPIKLGAKNWLFIGHANAGPRTAMMFTLAENCRILGVNPEESLSTYSPASMTTQFPGSRS